MNNIRRKLFLFLEKRTFLELLSYFFTTIILFAVIYYSLTPGENGIVTSGTKVFNIWQGFYFSIVTISSLGYGDMHPQGYSQLFAVVEVIWGLSLMGIIVAKLTSSRLSYHVRRIYISDSQRQLYSYLQNIRQSSSDISKAILIFSSEMIETPTINETTPNDKNDSILIERARKSFSTSFEKISKSFSELTKYFDFEVTNGDYFSEIPIDTIKDIGISIENFQDEIYPFLNSISEKRKNELLYGEPGKYFNLAISEVINICDIVKKHTKETNIKLLFSNISNKSIIIKNNILIISVPIFENEPPNQIWDESTNPAN